MEELNFYVNDTNFNGKIDMNNEIEIKSNTRNYNVTYNNLSLKEILNRYYNEKDYVLIDENVFKIDESCLDNINEKYFYKIEALEKNKNIENVLQIIDNLANIKFTKNNKIIVIGGGITQDISGMVCAIYKRGLEWLFIPTTILSMTDSAIGSKLCLNRTNKNLLGLFYAPHNILISNYFFETLKNHDKISGLGEALKLGLIGGNKSLNIFLENYDKGNYVEIIKMATYIKKLIIEKDELEKNERKVLNYGHTIGHALETATNYIIPHGIAVLYGMYFINRLFYEDKYKYINDYIDKMIPDKFKNLKIDYKKLLEYILNDKKNKGNKVCFILLDEYGRSIFVYKEVVEFREKLENIMKEFFNLN